MSMSLNVGYESYTVLSAPREAVSNIDICVRTLSGGLFLQNIYALVGSKSQPDFFQERKNGRSMKTKIVFLAISLLRHDVWNNLQWISW